MRKTIISLVVALASLVPGGVLADGMPPSSAKTAEKDAPGGASRVTQADLQPDAPDQYTVQKGDTLWGLAGRFLKDPWKWPQIWQMNRDQIKDPHWIYPGDVIRLDRSGPSLSLASAGGVGGASGGSASDAASNVVKIEPRTRIESLQEAIPSIPGSAIGPFLSRPLVVELGGLDTAPAIIATEESRVIIGAGDSAYADRIGSDDGLNWQIFRPGVALRDPESGEILGYEASYVGDARVRRFGHPTTLEVTKARQEINRGDRLMPARESALPTYIPRAPAKQIRGSIMSVDGGVSELGQYQIVALNRGARDGLEVGHVLASYRRGELVGGRSRGMDIKGSGTGFNFGLGGMEVRPVPVVPDPPSTAVRSGDVKVGRPASGGPIRLPDERNGLVFVFRVFDKMSYAMVMRASRPIYVGDVVQTP
ncbi:MAG TPA: LysM peptidoglycan-binding domain-containing protein [Usitatibacter sp.]|nr:LysM peptidoglycan-binding domain-containing protein [Usitatibacter sp.]